MKKNLLILHGGGPTAVINASLYGAVSEAKAHPQVEHIYGAIGGTGGFLKGQMKDLKEIPEERLRLLLTSPGSAIGTSRDHLEPEDYDTMAQIIQHQNIGWVLCNGGNGSMDMCGKLYAACRRAGAEVRVMGIPKTMDNDIAITDHSPGYGSAARYIAQSVQELCADVRSMPIHVVVLEALGRNAGWVTASSALARTGGQDGPDLVYLPERPFSEDDFLQDVSTLLQKKTGLVVVASEGLTDKDGKNIVPPVFQVGRSVNYGDVSAHLSGMITKKLGYKARGEKPGLLGRASATLQSPVDREEARIAGQLACRAALEGETGKMVAFRRADGPVYSAEPFLVEIEKVMLTERKMPQEYINARGNGVTQQFVDWCRPLIGDELPELVSFR